MHKPVWPPNPGSIDWCDRSSFSCPWLGWKRWARARFSWAPARYACSVKANRTERGTSDMCSRIAFLSSRNDRSVKQYIVRGSCVTASQRLRIINHKVNKMMHSTVLSESASLLPSRAIRNLIFPLSHDYELVALKWFVVGKNKM